jgi:hypothetical protein
VAQPDVTMRYLKPSRSQHVRDKVNESTSRLAGSDSALVFEISGMPERPTFNLSKTAATV